MARQVKKSGPISAREKAAVLALVTAKYGGTLRPSDVVREANPSNKAGIAHQLASFFTWDDQRAAELWRIDEARRVIRSVEPELIRLGVITVEAPHYVHDPGTSEQGYVRLSSIKTDREVAADAMEAEMQRAVAALSRAYAIAMALGRQVETEQASAALAALGHQPAREVAIA